MSAVLAFAFGARRRRGGGADAERNAETYVLDENERVVSVQNVEGQVLTRTYAVGKMIASETRFDGSVVSYAYDADGNLATVAYPDEMLAFTYDGDGLRTSASNSVGVVTNEYDAATGWLASSHGADGTTVSYAYSDGGVAYTYDAAGNRMTRTENGETITYTLGVGDRLATYGRAASPLAADGGAYTHNRAGCVTRIERDGRPTLDLTWDSQYQLVSVSTNGEFAESYAYDALGRRVSTTTLEGTVRHVYDDSWQCLADIGENGNVLRSYVWGEGIDNLLAVKIGGESYYPLTDIQGTVWGYADSSNNIVAHFEYDAWGNVLSEDVAIPVLATLRYRFQGREWSATTGLINFRMRWYDANVGRWLSKDSAGLKGGINLFVLCRNDPVNFFDADGCGFLGLFAKTAKMTWKLISRTHAEKMLKKHQTVTMKGKGCGKKAKRLVESATGKKTVRHDGHGPGQAPHYQPKNGGGAHVRVPGAHLTEGMGLFGDAIDFFNPLSDAQDLIDLVQDVAESFD